MNTMLPDRIIETVRSARNKWPFDVPEIKNIIVQSKIGIPKRVHTPQGKLSYWLVPLLSGDKVSGFAVVNLTGELLRLGVFGKTFGHRENWIAETYFQFPPKQQLDELKQKYPEHSLSDPLFTFDGASTKFAWLIKVKWKGKAISYAFILPDNWYEKGSLS